MRQPAAIGMMPGGCGKDAVAAPQRRRLSCLMPACVDVCILAGAGPGLAWWLLHLGWVSLQGSTKKRRSTRGAELAGVLVTVSRDDKAQHPSTDAAVHPPPTSSLGALS